MPVTVRQSGTAPLLIVEPALDVSLLDASGQSWDVAMVTDILPVEKRATTEVQAHCTAPHPCESQQADVRAAVNPSFASVQTQNVAMEIGPDLLVEKRAIMEAQALCTAPQLDVRAAGSSASHILDPSAMQFIWRDPNLVHKGLLRPDLDHDWASVQAVQAGHAGPRCGADYGLWGHVIPMTSNPSHHVELLPFSLTSDDLGDALPAPARPLLRASSLKDKIILTPSGPFTDKILPSPAQPLLPREIFTPEYFSSLHNLVAAAGIRADGSTYPALTPNYMGARIKLEHVGMKIDRWIYHLRGY